MQITSPPRRAAALFTVLAVAVGSLLLPTAAVAAEGLAPAPTEYRVLGGVHADAVSTFLDEGTLALGSKADVPEGNGTRFAADEVWFHLEDGSQRTVPAGYEFLGPVGSTVWMAPESNPGAGKLWPGFNTESVPTGAIAGDRSRFTLTSFEGPGQLEVFTGGGFGAPNRLWSSTDESLRTFEIGRTHMHANWSFTAPGTYRIGVGGTVTINGTAQTASATYTFVVGELPEPVATSVALSVVGDSMISIGGTVSVRAAVTPAGAEGYVEFRNGTTVLGHEEVQDGAAAFTVSGLGVGGHNLTAHFVPKVSNNALSSVSEPVTVTVDDGSGVPFGVSGVRESYAPGETLTATLAGYALASGDQVRWRIRPVGSDSANGVTLATAVSPTYSMVVNISDDGYELSAQVRQGSTPVATTDWVAVTVASGAPVVSAPTLNAATLTPTLSGDRVVLDYPALGLTDGETAQLVFRTSSSRWAPVAGNTRFVNVSETGTQAAFHARNTGTFSFAIRVVKDGTGVRQSAATSVPVGFYEAHVEGVQSLYREGQTLSATGRFYPIREGVDDVSYEWRWYAPDNSFTIIGSGTGAPSPVVRELTAADNGSTLYLTVSRPYGSTSSSSSRVNVTNAAGQLFQFPPVSEHYHQNDKIDLRASVDPALSDDDTVTWEWKWPGSEWEPFTGMTRLGQQINAEQALNGVEVRATLHLAGEDREPMVAGPVTIHIDDHGAAARQTLTISGDTSVTDGETVTLTRELPENGQTILTQHRWERKAAGADEWSVITGQDSATLSFTGGPGDDGAQYRVSILKPDGTVAYGPSPAVTLSVEAAPSTTPSAPAKPGISVDGATAVVSWVAPSDGGSALTGFTVALSGGTEPVVKTVAAGASSVAFTELQPGTYSATVVATNAVGDSDPSPSSDPVTVSDNTPNPEPEDPTVPSVPAKPGISVDGARVVVSWVAPSDGGSALTGFTVAVSGGTEPVVKTVAAGASSVAFTELQPGTYSATVVATNAVGDSDPSLESDPVTVTASTPGGEIAPVPDSQLTDDTRHGVRVPEAVTPGGQITVTVPGHEGEQVRVWLHSTPVLLGAVTLDGNDAAVLTVPADAALGQHRVVVQAMDGTLVGWAPITLAAASQIGADGGLLAHTGGGSPTVPLTIALLLMTLGAGTWWTARSRGRRSLVSD